MGLSKISKLNVPPTSLEWNMYPRTTASLLFSGHQSRVLDFNFTQKRRPPHLASFTPLTYEPETRTTKPLSNILAMLSSELKLALEMPKNWYQMQTEAWQPQPR
jgi:hypothetical protein